MAAPLAQLKISPRWFWTMDAVDGTIKYNKRGCTEFLRLIVSLNCLWKAGWFSYIIVIFPPISKFLISTLTFRSFRKTFPDMYSPKLNLQLVNYWISLLVKERGSTISPNFIGRAKKKMNLSSARKIKYFLEGNMRLTPDVGFCGLVIGIAIDKEHKGQMERSSWWKQLVAMDKRAIWVTD